jgi:hypothetical protein
MHTFFGWQISAWSLWRAKESEELTVAGGVVMVWPVTDEKNRVI